jgi:hypothetical protein
MSEREIRNIIRSVCAELDQRAKRAAQNTAKCVVLPAMLGLSLSVTGCKDKELKKPDGQGVAGGQGQIITPMYMAPMAGSSGANVGAGGKSDTGPVAIYAAPLGGSGGAVAGNKDAGVKDAGPQVKYMAPDAQVAADSGADKDASVMPLYMAALYAAPFDAGAQAEYAAPIADSGPMVRYMAPNAGK